MDAGIDDVGDTRRMRGTDSGCQWEIIKKDPRWIMGTSEWYGVFLESARLILRREPKWSPDYKAQGRNGKVIGQ